jgi:subtilisin family serine protease
MRIRRVITITGLAISVVIWAAGLVSASEPVNPVRSNLNALATTSNGVKVAILDSGCDIAYQEGISLIDGTLKDYKGHGTLMASIIRETCPQAQLYIVKAVEKEGLILDEEAVILGLEWAISRNVDVINMSLRLKDSERLHEVIQKAYRQGIVIVAAAGNNSTRMGLARNFAQVGAISLTEVAYPAKYSEVIAVGALDRNGRVYGASIKGEKVEVFCKGYKGSVAGTSVASAYAAGLVVKIISENPAFGPEKIREIMQQARQEPERDRLR